VVYAISGPLRAGRRLAGESSPSGTAAAGHHGGGVGPDAVAELEAARDAKYREIRDAEMDVRTGKLSDADYQAIDSTLRAEAMEILRALDGARED
jgi:hypothetical protein